MDQPLFSNRSGSARPDGRFQEPDSAYAPHAFWFWNEAEELKDPAHFSRMAQEMARQRLNPGYVHARHYKPHEPFWL